MEVTDTPAALTNADQIDICEGEDFSLGTSTTGPGYTYSWTGPNGYISNQANPPALTNATSLQAGIYTLVVSANGCPSVPDTTVVNITNQPAQPSIASPGLACTGDDVVFITNISGADLYTWIAPDFSTQTTTTNLLNLTNVSTADAGNWSVFVTVDGCSSIPSNPVMLFVEPELNVLAANDGPACEGSPVQLSASAIPGASYVWNGPGGFVSLMQNPSTSAQAGTYSVTVTAVSGCSQVATTEVLVNVVPQITGVSNSGAPCVTGAEDITLSVTVNPPDLGDYTYLWTGPNNYSSISSSPVLPNGTSADNGSYIVIVTSGAGCTSQPMETLVNVSDAPATPVISGDQQFCAGEAMSLSTDGYTGTNVVYNWITPSGMQVTSIPSLSIAMLSPADSGTYQVFVTVDGCDSNLSPAFEVEVNPVPDQPVVTADSLVCTGGTIELETAFIPGATYTWTGPAGFNAAVFNPVIFDATQDNEGAYCRSDHPQWLYFAGFYAGQCGGQ